jgi:hypothetical protein
MSVNFPNSPSNGQQLINDGKTYTYNSAKTSWKLNAPGFDSAQVVNILNANVVDSAVVNSVLSTSSDVLDSSQVISLVSTNSNKVYTVANITALVALSGMATGDQSLVTATNKLYMYNGSGWYIIATITNGSPSAISGVDSDYTLALDGTATVINAIATDPEGLPLTWSSSSSGLTNEATITQGTGDSSNYFTVTPSTTSAHAGTFTLTIAATDNVNGAVNWPIGFTLDFSIAWNNAALQQKLRNSDYTTSHTFGGFVDLAGDYLLATAYRYDGDGYQNTGAGFIFTRSGTTWTQQAKLDYTTTYNENNVQLGQSGVLNEDATEVLMRSVGKISYGDLPRITSFTRSGSTWTEGQSIIQPTGIPTTYGYIAKWGQYGNLVQKGNYFAVGAEDDHGTASTSGATRIGSAWVYYKSGTWSLQQELVPSDTGDLDFGEALCMPNDSTIMVGAPNYNGSKGAVYIFERTGTSWSQTARILSPTPTVENIFGSSVASDGTYLAVGQTKYPSKTNVGIVYMYKKISGTWTQQTSLQASDASGGEYFGEYVSMRDGNLLVAGYAHKVYVFSRSGDVWTQKLIIGPSIDGSAAGDGVWNLGRNDGGMTFNKDDTKDDFVLGSANRYAYVYKV